jgi:lipopolysaccharide export system protein LptA
MKLIICIFAVMQRILFYFLIFLFTPSILKAQKPEKIELMNADVSEYDEKLNANATRLIGNVIFRHQNAIMYCDSAYLYRNENRLEAFNNIRIKQGDSLNLTGKRLLYDGNTKIANVFDDVIMTDGKMTLNTSRLDYDMAKDIASYSDSGHIVDGENVLTSKLGYFYSETHDLYFRKNVLLVNPKYTMNCDTLKYNTIVKTAFFLGPTYIHSTDNIIYCESGEYNTITQKSNFTDNSYLQTKEQRLKGDSVHYDRLSGIGKVFGNVSIEDTTNDIIITGDYGEYHELTDSSWVTGHAMVTQIYDGDSLFLHGDTLVAIGEKNDNEKDNRQKKKNLFAFHHVKIFKNDLQGVCDSLVFDRKDSTIRLYYLPVLWSGLNQLTADSITLQTANAEITHIYLVNNSFITALADSESNASLDSTRYNQIRGKNMTGLLKENKLYRIDVSGNGQTIYYAKDKKQKNFAVNRADCSDLVIYVEENKVKSITLLNEPDGTLYPIRQLSTSELRLKGFSWYGDKRPKSRDDIFFE